MSIRVSLGICCVAKTPRPPCGVGAMAKKADAGPKDMEENAQIVLLGAKLDYRFLRRINPIG